MKKSTIAIAVGIVMGGAAMSANAALTSSATLDFVLGTAQTVSCNYGTTPPCNKATYAVTDIVGSYFGMDIGATPGTIVAAEKTGIESFNGIHLGTLQGASGSHAGAPDGTENQNIDNPWFFAGNTGMHQTLGTAITGTADAGGNGTMDFSGWNVTWNGIASIPVVATSPTTITCDQASCSDSSNYTIDGTFHVAGAGFTTVGYELHLEGHVSAIPVPAAVWLFGSGLLGLVGVARRRKSS